MAEDFGLAEKQTAKLEQFKRGNTGTAVILEFREGYSRQMNPMISLAATTGLMEAISAAGGDPDRVLAAVGLKRSSLDKANALIPCATFARLLEEAAQATGDHCFGLHFGERLN